MAVFGGILTGGETGANKEPMQMVVGSNWSNLNPKLLATLQPMIFSTKDDGKGNKSIEYLMDTMTSVVVAPIKQDGSMEVTASWTSAFEGEAQEAKKPLITSLIASGQFSYALQKIEVAAGADSKQTENALSKLVGRTTMTKLNSTQTFTGAPPIKTSITMIFKAFTDPLSEVVYPVATLLSWALPQLLSPDGALMSALIGADGKVKAPEFENAFPSIAPRIVCYTYGNQKLKPMVIESISIPSSYPMDTNGNPVYLEVSMQLGTLTGKDATEVADMFGINK